MHAAGAFTVVDFQLAVFQPHAFRRTEVKNFLLNVEGAPILARVGSAIGLNLTADVCGHSFLINADFIAPRTDEGHVRTGDGGHTTVGAAVKFELELIGEGRTMQFVLIFLSQLITQLLRIIAGPFTAGICPRGA